MKKKDLVIYDVCGTITKNNNTTLFIGFVLKNLNFSRFILFLGMLIISPIICFLENINILEREFIRQKSIYLLKGFKEKDIQELSKKYVEQLVKRNKFNKNVLLCLRKEQKLKKIILVSASIDPPIKEIAKFLNVKTHYSSLLEIKRGIYTGKLKEDLLGTKDKIRYSYLKEYNFKTASIYSDNLEDKSFIQKFGKINIINNTDLKFDNAKVNYIFTEFDKSINSINKKTLKFIYFPTLYYIVSRFHKKGIISLFINEIFFIIIFLSFFTNLAIFKSIFFVSLSYLIFYSVYEIGGLFNDLKANMENIATRTNRISDGVKVNIFLFLALRFFVLFFGLSYFLSENIDVTIYLIILFLTIIIYLSHSLIRSYYRIITFTLLKIFRSIGPLVIFFGFLPINLFYVLLFSFFITDAPLRIFNYLKKFGVVKLNYMPELESKYFFPLIMMILLSTFIYQEIYLLLILIFYKIFIKLLTKVIYSLTSLISFNYAIKSN